MTATDPRIAPLILPDPDAIRARIDALSEEANLYRRLLRLANRLGAGSRPAPEQPRPTPAQPAH